MTFLKGGSLRTVGHRWYGPSVLGCRRAGWTYDVPARCAHGRPYASKVTFSYRSMCASRVRASGHGGHGGYGGYGGYGGRGSHARRVEAHQEAVLTQRALLLVTLLFVAVAELLERGVACQSRKMAGGVAWGGVTGRGRCRWDRQSLSFATAEVTREHA